MNLEGLQLEDFGTYAGRQDVDLRCEPGRPVVLIGGTNGAGKTTLLEAMLLCLHGRRALWDSVSLRAYHEHIASRLHRAPDTGSGNVHRAAVQLTFSHAEAGLSSLFVVRRSWKRSPKGAISETLALSRNGEPVEDHTGGMAQGFLDGILPPALASLYFFDGEQIQNLADDDTGRELRTAVRRLLGLDLLERLRHDLTRYASRAPGLGAVAAPQKRLELAHQALDAAVVALDAGSQREAHLLGSEHSLQLEIVACRERFEREGGAVAEARGSLERRARQARQRADRAEHSLRELITGLLPLALCPDITRAVSARLEHEGELEQDEIVRDRVLQRADQLAARFPSGKGGTNPAAELLDILAGPPSAHPRVHDLSPAERVRVLDNLQAAREAVPERAARPARALRRGREQEAALGRALDGAPDASDLAPLVEELQELGRRLGAAEQEIKDARIEVASLRHAHEEARRELDRASEEVLLAAQSSDRSATALRTVAVLDEFETATAVAKLHAVAEETARYFNRLSRKRELLSAVVIDPDTFALQLRRWDGAVLPKERLSAGERQLLAIALLWALRTVSGRPLPVVIDTPLARLDVEHRQRILGDYLPNASHQVVVLATDSEIDAVAASSLAESVSHRYHLDHDVRSFSTQMRRGYFEEAAADAR